MSGPYPGRRSFPADYHQDDSASYPPQQVEDTTSSFTRGQLTSPQYSPEPEYTQQVAAAHYDDDPGTMPHGSVPFTQGFTSGSDQGPPLPAHPCQNVHGQGHEPSTAQGSSTTGTSHDEGRDINGYPHVTGPTQSPVPATQHVVTTDGSSNQGSVGNTSVFNHTGSCPQSPVPAQAQFDPGTHAADPLSQGHNHGGYEPHDGQMSNQNRTLFDGFQPDPAPRFSPPQYRDRPTEAQEALRAFDNKYYGRGRSQGGR